MRWPRGAAVAPLAVLAAAGTGHVPARPDRLGGPATVNESGPGAFSLPIPGLSTEDRRAFSVGNSLFRDNWVVAPATASGRDGLGPLFNANSCSACHPDDGRGKPPPSADDVGLGMVVMASPREADGMPHPVYGRQLQDQAVPGVEPEARILLEPVATRGNLPDGTAWELVRWRPEVVSPAYGPTGDLRLSVRIGPQLVGGGLLEAVPDESLVARADPDDSDGDGISGRAHRVGPSGRIGRFGWKASQPTLDDQVRAALHEDIGITSDAHPAEALTPLQRASVQAASGGEPEIDAHKLARIAHYCRTLAVPAQRGAGTEEVERGRALFEGTGCAACHVATLATGQSSPIAMLRGIEFHPYTDLLLHDMGDGLADGRRDGEATGREWRTQPLWGIGLIETVNGHSRLLHDGRARDMTEAILWHGGEAQRARDRFAGLSQADRAAMIAFLRSL
jgi:CxxC motif-containing protein (DUF1111 family)